MNYSILLLIETGELLVRIIYLSNQTLFYKCKISIVSIYLFLAHVGLIITKVQLYDDMLKVSGYEIKNAPVLYSHRAHWIPYVFFHKFCVIIVIISYGHLSHSHCIPHSGVIPQGWVKNALNRISCDISCRKCQETCKIKKSAK